MTRSQKYILIVQLQIFANKANNHHFGHIASFLLLLSSVVSAYRNNSEYIVSVTSS